MHRHGFTLIELLVVIAILAILMALLVPLSTRMINVSKQSTCTANLQNLGRVYNLHASDHGTLPVSNSRNPYAITTYQAPPLKEYMDSLGLRADVWYCPNMIEQVPEMEVTDWMNWNDPRIHGIAGDEFIIGYSIVVNPDGYNSNKHKKVPLRNRADYFGVQVDWVVDTCAAWRPPNASPTPVGVLSWRTFPHYSKENPHSSNILRGDGSVEQRRMADLTWGYRYHHPVNTYW